MTALWPYRDIPNELNLMHAATCLPYQQMHADPVMLSADTALAISPYQLIRADRITVSPYQLIRADPITLSQVCRARTHRRAHVQIGTRRHAPSNHQPACGRLLSRRATRPHATRLRY